MKTFVISFLVQVYFYSNALLEFENSLSICNEIVPFFLKLKIDFFQSTVTAQYPLSLRVSLKTYELHVRAYLTLASFFYQSLWLAFCTLGLLNTLRSVAEFHSLGKNGLHVEGLRLNSFTFFLEDKTFE